MKTSSLEDIVVETGASISSITMNSSTKEKLGLILSKSKAITFFGEHAFAIKIHTNDYVPEGKCVIQWSDGRITIV